MTTTSEQPGPDHRDLVERYVAAYNAMDVPAMIALLHHDVVFRNVAGGEETASADGLDEFRQLAERAVELFSSRRQVIRSFEGRGDAATVEVDYEGVLAVDLGPGLRAGDVLRLQGRSLFRFRDGMIAGIVDES